MSSKEIGEKLVALCREGKNLEAIETLYSDDIRSIEAVAAEDDAQMPREMNGREAIVGKNQWWLDNHEVHSAEIRGPFPHDERFAVLFNFDVTPKDGPMKGQRMKMEEVGLYTVEDGKIVREEFFYSM